MKPTINIDLPKTFPHLVQLDELAKEYKGKRQKAASDLRYWFRYRFEFSKVKQAEKFRDALPPMPARAIILVY